MNPADQYASDHGGNRRALVALLLGALGIAFAPMFTRDIQDFGGVDPTVAAFWRVALAAPLLFLLMFLLDLRARMRTRMHTSECTRVCKRVDNTVDRKPTLRLARRDWLLLSVPGSRESEKRWVSTAPIRATR